MAKSPKTVSNTDAKLDSGEVSLHDAAPAESKGLANGLGLEKFIAIPAKPAEKKEHTPEPRDAADPDKKSVKPDAKPPVKDASKPDDKKSDGKKSTKDDASSKKETVTVESLSKRLEDTRNWATKVNSENIKLRNDYTSILKEVDILKQKLAGTYVEPKEPSPDDKAKLAVLEERVKISRALAEELYGPEFVQETVYAENSPYLQLEQMDPLVKARVFNADRPVIEAIKIVKERQFRDKYGDDPEKIHAAIREEVRQEIVDEIKRAKSEKKTVESVNGLHGVHAISDKDTGIDPGKTGKPTSVDLRSIFGGNFPTGA